MSAPRRDWIEQTGNEIASLLVDLVLFLRVYLFLYFKSVLKKN